MVIIGNTCMKMKYVNVNTLTLTCCGEYQKEYQHWISTFGHDSEKKKNF